MQLEVWSQVATISTGVAAVLALALGIWQVNKSRLAQERATSFDIYVQFLNRALDLPEFMHVELTPKEIAEQTFAGSKVKFAKYEVYIDLMIVTFEELLRQAPNDFGVKSYIKSYFIGHKAYFCSDNFRDNFREQLEPDLRAYLDVLREEWGAPATRGK